MSAETTYSCDVCGKKYIRKPALKKHIQIKHTRQNIISQQIIRDSLPLPMPANCAFTPLQVASDDSELFLDVEPVETPSANLQESTVIQEETGPHYMESNWQCGECGEVLKIIWIVST